jgi:hypothetical protein
MTTPNSPQVLLQQMAQIQHMERGKLCILRQGPDGPYYNHQTWENGKNTTHYVPRQQVEALAEAIAGYQNFARLTGQYVELMVEKTRAERTAGLKKKTPPRKSAWPRKRKSSN